MLPAKNNVSKTIFSLSRPDWFLNKHDVSLGQATWFLFLAASQHVFWSLKDVIPSIVWGYGEEMLDNGNVWSPFVFLQLGTILIQAPTLGTSR